MRNAWRHLLYFAHYTVGAGFTSAATRSKLGFAGTGAGARLAAIVQAILIAQLILRVEAIPIVQTISALLASLIGGFHLGDKSAHEVETVIAELKRLGVRQVAPSHCTGEKAIEQFKAAFGADFIQAGVGLPIIAPAID